MISNSNALSSGDSAGSGETLDVSVPNTGDSGCASPRNVYDREMAEGKRLLEALAADVRAMVAANQKKAGQR